MTGRSQRYALEQAVAAAAAVVEDVLTDAGFHGPFLDSHGQLEVGVPSSAIHPL